MSLNFSQFLKFQIFHFFFINNLLSQEQLSYVQEEVLQEAF